MTRQLKMRALLLASVGCGVPTAALAQEAAVPATSNPADSNTAAAAPTEVAPANALQDIVVTATKRATNVQDTPLAITAVGGADLRLRQITSVENLAPSLPNVNFGKNVGFARIAIRGVGLDTTVAGQEGRVAYHSDGIYISRPSAAIATFFDVNRVEVVRGPQGTLYGRNATAGAINVITNDPEQDLSGYGKVTVGNYGLINTEGAVTTGLTDTLSARVAFQTVDRSGYGRGLVTGEEIDNEHSYGVRGKLKFQPSSALTSSCRRTTAMRTTTPSCTITSAPGAPTSCRSGRGSAGVSHPTRAIVTASSPSSTNAGSMVSAQLPTWTLAVPR